jgi:hypothetical protein
MLFGLRHDAVVGGDGKQNEVDAVSAGEHIFDKSLMSGHVDDARGSAIRQVEVGETQVDGDAALFFFFEPVGVLAREGFDQAGLAVIDMAGGADDVGHAKNFKLKIQNYQIILGRSLV